MGKAFDFGVVSCPKCKKPVMTPIPDKDRILLTCGNTKCHCQFYIQSREPTEDELEGEDE